MQRGANKRDPRPLEKGSDYAGLAPVLRVEDRAHLGLTDVAFARLAAALKEKVLGYARGGFRKPADVSRLLNKEKIRTLAGTEWNPRLVHFLLTRIFGGRPRARPVAPTKAADVFEQNSFDEARKAVGKRARQRRRASEDAAVNAKRNTNHPARNEPGSPAALPNKPSKPIKVRPPTEPVPLSSDEMANRLAALKAHLDTV